MATHPPPNMTTITLPRRFYQTNEFRYQHQQPPLTNMVNKGGVSVRVAHVEFKEADLLNFYQEHESNGAYYIKVATGEQFVVIIDITPEFNFMRCPDVQIRCSIDGEAEVMWFLSAAEMATLRDQHSMRRINYFDTERVIDNKWMSCALSFADLTIDDTGFQAPEYDRNDCIHLGRVAVTIRRGTAKACAPERMMPNECASDVSVACRAAVEDHHITHTMKALPLEERPQPWVHCKFSPASGPAGDKLRLYVHYRSQEALELLGVVSKTHIGVKHRQRNREESTIRTGRAPIRPNLDAEADVKVENGPVTSKGTRERTKGGRDVAATKKLPVSSKVSKARGKTPASKTIQKWPETGSKRKRKASPTTTSKKTKTSSVGAKSKRVAVPKSPVSNKKIVSRQQDSDDEDSDDEDSDYEEDSDEDDSDGDDSDEEDDDDEVQFISERPVRRLVGRYVIEDSDEENGVDEDSVDEDGDDEVQFVSERPVRRVVGRYVID